MITPDIIQNGLGGLARDLLVSLAAAGVTATCSRAAGPRYGSVDVDSNLPDFRIALGGPDQNAFTAEVLAACDPAVAKRLAALLADGVGARLWVPASRPRTSTFAPSADLRGPRDLPVLIVASAHPADLEKAVSELLADLRAETIRADVADGVVGVDEPLADGAVALVNRGTLGAVVAPDGTLWMSLFRACSSWPSGVWIDGDRRTAPDGSSFAWQHWSHTFSYALLSSGEDWRAGRFNARAEDYNHDLVAVVRDGALAGPAASPDLVSVGAPNVTLTALKPYGNPLASGRPGAPAAGRDVTVRLRETDGRSARALVRFAAGIEAAWRGDILEQAPGAPLTVRDGVAFVHLGPFETVTVTGPAGRDAFRPGRRGRPRWHGGGRAAGAGAARVHAVLAAQQGPGAGRERAGRGAPYADSGHAARGRRRPAGCG